MRFHPLRATVLAWLALLLVVFSLTPSAQAAASKTSNDDLARYADQLFSQTYPAEEPGAAVLVMKDGQVVLRKGYGMAHLELGVPIQPDQVFEIGSITKQFTATAILMLQERGKLSVDDAGCRRGMGRGSSSTAAASSDSPPSCSTCPTSAS